MTKPINAFLIGFFLLLIACKPHANLKKTLLIRTCDYLWSQQATDGGWHSETHGILRGGESLTAFILWSLLEIPKHLYQHPTKKVEQGMSFIRNHIKEGRLGVSDPVILDYPNYSTAYALRLLVKYGIPEDTAMIRAMGDYLLQEQFNEQRGIDTTHLAYGSWGFGETNLLAGKHGHIDLSHTRRILEALQEADRLGSATKKQASQFLKVLQKHKPSQSTSNTNFFDGGFFASSVTIGTNKGGVITTSKEDSMTYYASYATATCDGIIGLLTLDDKTNEPQLQKAKTWLLQHKELNYPQGIPKNTPEQWDEVMRFYHLAVRAKAYHALDYQGDWQEQVVEILHPQQQRDGSFSNPMGAPNKEDDPLLASTFAMIALSESY